MEIKQGIIKFLQHMEGLKRSPATITAYTKDLEQFQKSLNDKELSEITTKDIQNFLDENINNGYKSKTISRKLNSLKSFFKFLTESGIVLIDVSKPVPHPDFSTKLPRVLTETEYRSIRDAAKDNNRIYTIIEFMLQTGIRIGEISRLKIEDLKLDKTPAQVIIREDGSSPMRIIDLNNRIKSTLLEFLPHRLEVENDEGFLFNTKNGKYMMIRNIRSSINRVFKKAGVKNATVNDIRNTFIVFQLNKGVSLIKIAQTVGHKRPSSTEKYLPLMTRKKVGNGSVIQEL